MSSVRLGQLIPLEIDADIFLSAILLDVPMIGIACVSAVLDPDSPFHIDVPHFALFGTVCNYVFLDDWISISVFDEFRLEWDGAARWQCSFFDLPNNLFGKLFRHDLPPKLDLFWAIANSRLLDLTSTFERGSQDQHFSIVHVLRSHALSLAAAVSAKMTASFDIYKAHLKENRCLGRETL